MTKDEITSWWISWNFGYLDVPILTKASQFARGLWTANSEFSKILGHINHKKLLITSLFEKKRQHLPPKTSIIHRWVKRTFIVAGNVLASLHSLWPWQHRVQQLGTPLNLFVGRQTAKDLRCLKFATIFMGIKYIHTKIMNHTISTGCHWFCRWQDGLKLTDVQILLLYRNTVWLYVGSIGRSYWIECNHVKPHPLDVWERVCWGCISILNEDLVEA